MAISTKRSMLSSPSTVSSVDAAKQVVSISMDSSLRVWSPKTAEEKLQISGQKFHQGGIVFLRLVTDNRTALTAGADNLVILSSLEDGRIFSKSIDLGGSIASIDYSDAWKAVFVTTFEGKMVTLSKDTFKILHEEEEKVLALDTARNRQIEVRRRPQVFLSLHCRWTGALPFLWKDWNHQSHETALLRNPPVHGLQVILSHTETSS